MYTTGSAQPVTEVQRWDRSKELAQKISVQAPNIVTSYNKNMGGVDKMDSLIAFYRIFFRNKKWYHRIFWHMVDMCICNAWLLYRRDREAALARRQPAVVAKPEHYLTLMQFKFSISYCLRKLNKAREGRPKKGVSIGRIAAPKMKVRHRVGNKQRPPQCVRHDQVGHFPAPMKKRGRCKYD